MNPFVYNCKTGNLYYNLSHGVYRLVQFEHYSGGIYFFIKDRKMKRYLVQSELRDLADTVRFMLERGADFGPEVNNLASSYLIA